MKKIICCVLWAVLCLSPFVLIFTLPLKQVDNEPTVIYQKDGCDVYRYYDKGNRLYFTKCSDGGFNSPRMR